jgi:hypothetical protein
VVLEAEGFRVESLVSVNPGIDLLAAATQLIDFFRRLFFR